MIRITESIFSDFSRVSTRPTVRINLVSGGGEPNFNLSMEFSPDSDRRLRVYSWLGKNVYQKYKGTKDDAPNKVASELEHINDELSAEFEKRAEEIGTAAYTALLSMSRKYMIEAEKNEEDFMRKYEEENS